MPTPNQNPETVAPCPFCGEKFGHGMVVWEKEFIRDGVMMYYYKCVKCRCLGPCAGSVESALERWNLRP